MCPPAVMTAPKTMYCRMKTASLGTPAICSSLWFGRCYNFRTTSKFHVLPKFVALFFFFGGDFWNFIFCTSLNVDMEAINTSYVERIHAWLVGRGVTDSTHREKTELKTQLRKKHPTPTKCLFCPNISPHASSCLISNHPPTSKPVHWKQKLTMTPGGDQLTTHFHFMFFFQ